MGEWRYHAVRPGSGLWLDSNVQLSEPELTWALSAPNSGKARIARGSLITPTAFDLVDQTLRKNWVYNPTAEVDALNWQLSGVNHDRVAPSALILGGGGLRPVGDWIFRINALGGGTAQFVATQMTTMPCAPGQWAAAHGRAWIAAGRNIRMRLAFYNGGSLIQGAYSPYTVSSTVSFGWSMDVAAIQAPPDTTHVRAFYYMYEGTNSPAAPTTPYSAFHDATMVVIGDTEAGVNAAVAKGYFAGNTQRTQSDVYYKWEGTPHASPSLEVQQVEVPRVDENATKMLGEDGEPIWSKWNTLLLAEEDGKLAWAGICTTADPTDKGLDLEFVGPRGWLQGVPFLDVLSVWKTNAFDVLRTLLAHSEQYTPGFKFVVPTHDSQYTVGDPNPPPKPKKPGRRKGESKTDYADSDRIKKWEKEAKQWDEDYGDYERFEIAYYEGPYVGEEMDTLAKEVGFDYREGVEWVDPNTRKVRYTLYFADSIRNRRTDIEFVDGINIAAALDPSAGDEKYANHVITLGAGEGRKMRTGEAVSDDGRLYQGEFVEYKDIRQQDRLRKLAQADVDRLSNTTPKIGSVVVWDVAGFASISTLRVGDEVKIVSENTTPRFEAWHLVTGITRNPTLSTVTLNVEAVG